MIKVLIAENDPMVSYLNRRYLSQVDGFIFIAATGSGKEALEIIKAQKIDLVITSILLQDLAGVELMTNVRMLSYPTDFIIISSVYNNQTVQAALRLGAVDYLMKPFEFERFHTALSNYKKRVKLFQGQQALTQSALDRYVFKTEISNVADFPKGIDRNTLKSIWAHINHKEGCFSTEEMAKCVGISRVSMRKYLEFLLQMDVLKLDVNYGSIGRPVYRYYRVAATLPF